MSQELNSQSNKAASDDMSMCETVLSLSIVFHYSFKYHTCKEVKDGIRDGNPHIQEQLDAQSHCELLWRIIQHCNTCWKVSLYWQTQRMSVAKEQNSRTVKKAVISSFSFRVKCNS